MSSQNSHPVICILGMHRSGTSCLTGSLQEAGLYLGDVVTQAPYNAKGNRENLQIMALHEKILSDNNMSWDAPSGTAQWRDEHRIQRDAIIHSYPSDRIWGFKDPRTLLTLSGWLEKLPTLQFVGTFRHPLAVAASLMARNKFSLEKCMTLWMTYNRLLLQYQYQFHFPLISFDLPPESYIPRLTSIVHELSLETSCNGFSFFETKLRKNHTGDNMPLPEQIDAIFQALQRIARK